MSESSGGGGSGETPVIINRKCYDWVLEMIDASLALVGGDSFNDKKMCKYILRQGVRPDFNNGLKFFCVVDKNNLMSSLPRSGSDVKDCEDMRDSYNKQKMSGHPYRVAEVKMILVE